ncbi:MAG TPA: Clp protease N-terminal domain-containing protein [Candidatus Angelobacter sp.]|jgi:ATP-dependent Clp protease ATP-binding subunit ClpC
MFERYDEKARRTIFFARYEASQTGSYTIESLHLLLGILKENGTLFTLANQELSVNSLMEECRRALPVYGEKLPTSVDIPLSNECKQALVEAANQASARESDTVKPVHLLLGLMEASSDVAALLERHGITEKTLAEAPQNLPLRAAAARTQPVLEFVCQGERIASSLISAISRQNQIPAVGEEVVFTRGTKMDTYRVIGVRREYKGPVSETSVECALVKVVVECERAG